LKRTSLVGWDSGSPFFPTVETLVAQLIAAVLVIGSYFAARRFGGSSTGGATVEAPAPSMAAINA